MKQITNLFIHIHKISTDGIFSGRTISETSMQLRSTPKDLMVEVFSDTLPGEMFVH
jgi:hypothetical protein